jgi:transcription elongation factor/antiterminator RfaH
MTRLIWGPVVLSSTRQWYAVQTQPQREALAAEQLENQGFEVFFPRRVRTVRHARRLQTRLISYFPGYIFVALDLDRQQWRAINGTWGVQRLITAGDKPARIPALFIAGLRALADAEGVMGAVSEFNSGDQVQVLAGPFADLIGTLDRTEGTARVRVLFSVLGGVVPVTTGVDNLALAS